MKMKERFHAICRFLTMVSQGNHRVLFWLLGSAFAAATLPYLSLFFSARILNLLLAKSYRACLYTVVVFLLTQYGLGLFENLPSVSRRPKRTLSCTHGTENHRKGAGAGV